MPIERKTLVNTLIEVDKLLSNAQDKLARHLVNAEVKSSSPQAYKIGDDVFDKIERLRWELRDKMNFPNSKR